MPLINGWVQWPIRALGVKNERRIFTENISLEKLKEHEGEELKYKQLCKTLNIKEKGGKSKICQLKDIGLYCNLITLSNPTRYLISEIYDEKQIPINGHNKFQLFLEDLIIQLLKINNFQVLYMTNTQLLMSLYMVNSNYKVLKVPKLRRALEIATQQNYYNLYLAANKSGEILTKWVDRTLTKMEERKIIEYRKGYCLFRKIKTNQGHYFKKYEVPNTPPASECLKGKMSIEQRVGGCYSQAQSEYSIGENHYIPPEHKDLFNQRFNELIREEFDGKWDGGYKVKVIVPYDPKRVKAFQESKTIINTETQRKIKDTTQLDWLTGEERKKFIEEIISISPSIKYKELIENK